MLYLPGSPSALVWPEEWAIVLLWTGLGAAFAVGMRRRVAALGPGRQARLILGDYVEVLRAGSVEGHVTRRRLPIGIQTFRTIREEGCYYVDKTPHVRRLLDEGTHYFLSRPRRFGKSLFLDTLKELFEGNEPLFAGLAIHDGWDWSVRHPVLRLSFGSGNFNEPGRTSRPA